VLTQLKIAEPRVAAGSQYFVGHPLTSEDADGSAKAIATVLALWGMSLVMLVSALMKALESTLHFSKHAKRYSCPALGFLNYL